MKLHSLNDIFERRILRIPDYQRGFDDKKIMVMGLAIIMVQPQKMKLL